MKIAIILLNYKNPQETLACLDHLKKTPQLPYTLFVVDNHSEDGSKELLAKALRKEDYLIVSKENNGYAAGNNLGIKKALGKGFTNFLILNNDARVTPNLLEKLFTYLNNHPEAGIVGPGICEYQQPDILESAGSMVNFYNGKITRLHTGENKEVIKGKVLPCDYVGGACMAFTKKTIDTIGLIPEDYFLFFEENEWCQKAKENKLVVLCLGDALVLHKGSATIKQYSGLSEYYTYRNLVLFIRRNGNFLNKCYFYPYIILFALKQSLTKKNGGRFIRYIKDGFLNQDTFKKEGLK